MAREASQLVIFSVGHGARSWEEFLALLRSAGVVILADVRRFPASRRHPQFALRRMAPALAKAGIRYAHLGKALGGYRDEPGGYEACVQTEVFARALAGLETLAREAPTAFMCAERLPQQCHRRFIAAALEARGWRVLHLIEPDGVQATLPAGVSP